MQVFIGLLYVLELIVCFLMAGIILLQKPKGGGVGVSFGGGMGESLFGAQMGNVLTKATVVLAVIFLLNTVVLSRLTSSSGTSVMDGVSTPAPVANEALPLPGGGAGGAAPAAPLAPAGQ